MVILDNWRTARTAPAGFVAFWYDANFPSYSLYDASFEVAIGGLVKGAGGTVLYKKIKTIRHF